MLSATLYRGALGLVRPTTALTTTTTTSTTTSPLKTTSFQPIVTSLEPVYKTALSPEATKETAPTLPESEPVATDTSRIVATVEPAPEPEPAPAPVLDPAALQPAPTPEPAPAPVLDPTAFQPAPTPEPDPVPTAVKPAEFAPVDTDDSRIVATDEDTEAALWKQKEPEAIREKGFVAYLPREEAPAPTPVARELVTVPTSALIPDQIFLQVGAHLCKAADAFELLEVAATAAKAIANYTVSDRTLQARADAAWQRAVSLRTKLAADHRPDDALYVDEVAEVVEMAKQIHLLSELEAAQYGHLDVAAAGDAFWDVLTALYTSETTCVQPKRSKKLAFGWPWWVFGLLAAGGVGLVLWTERKG